MKINVKDLKRRIAIYNYFVWRQQRQRERVALHPLTALQ